MTTPAADLLGVQKPVVAMAHLLALPGTPRYDSTKSLEEVIEVLRRDIRTLLDNGVDAILFCNEDDRPYAFRAGPEAIAAMTRIVVELRPNDRPFGVDYLWDPFAALAVAKATDAAFIREVITGVYESDMGLWAPDAAALFRFRRQIGAENVRIFNNIAPEFASPLGQRSIAQRAHSACVSSVVDAILVSGPMAGAEVDLDDLKAAKGAVPPGIPVIANTGVKRETVARVLEIADGVIVGSSLKVDGYTWNRVDPLRTRLFMQEVRAARGSSTGKGV